MRIVILGAGEVGTHLARELSPRGEVILVDRSSASLATAEESLDVLTVCGDITHWKTLKSTEIKKSSLVVAVTGSDDANVVGAALAASLGAQRTVARVDAPAFYRTQAGLETGVLGIHSLLCAARLVSEELRRLVTGLDAQYVGNFCGNAVQVCAVAIRDTSTTCGVLPSAIKLPNNVNLLGVLRDGFLRAPVDVGPLEIDDTVLLSGAPSSVLVGARQVGGATGRRSVIVGGGDVGFQLARMLSETERHVQIIEQDRTRCEFLSESLRDVNIVHGDGTSIACLRDEHIESADYLAAVTRHDEVNLMVSLMAKDLGVPRNFTLVHRPGYSEVYDHLGVRGTTGPHEVIGRMVQRLLPSDGVLASEALLGSGYQVLELALPDPLRGKLRLDELALPAGVFVAGIGRKAAALPITPSTPIAAADGLVVVSPNHLIRDVERRLKRLGGRA